MLLLLLLARSHQTRHFNIDYLLENAKSTVKTIIDWITLRDVNCYRDVDTSVLVHSGFNDICQLLRDVYTAIMINTKLILLRNDLN